MAREHFFANKTEAAVQLVCAIVYFVGLLLISTQAHDSAFFQSTNGYPGGPEASPQFTFAVGLILILCLLYNAGAHMPPMTPLIIGLGFYFYTSAIEMLDSWVQVKDISGSGQFDSYDQLLAGGVLCMMSVSVAIIFEMSIPARTGREGALGAPELTASLFGFVSVAGLIVIWYHNPPRPEEWGQASKYSEITGLSLRCLLCIGLLADAVLHWDPFVSHSAVVLGSYVGCQMWFMGLNATRDGLSDDVKATYRGCLVCAFGICALVLAEVIISIQGRNKNETSRPKVFKGGDEAREGAKVGNEGEAAA